MKWLALLTMIFVIAGTSVLWHSFARTPSRTTMPQNSSYKDPYITSQQQREQGKQRAPELHKDAQYRTDPARPVAQPARVIEAQQTDNAIDEDPGYDRRAMEQLFFDEVNRQRVLRGLEALVLRKDLSRTARKYSKELAAGAQSEPGYDPRTAVVELRHFGDLFGLTVVERLAYKGVYDVTRAGENILSLPLDLSTYAGDGTLVSRTWRTPSEIVTDGVRKWMLSPKHRANILMPEYTHGGVGVFRLDNILVITEVFITEASCGYYKGPCCETGAACFPQYTCDTHRTEPECRKEEEL